MNAADFEDFKLHCRQLLGDFPDEKAQQFALYLREIVEWNKKFNLISFKAERDLFYRHFYDSLQAAKIVRDLSEKAEIKIADLGSGVGMPGIPTKIALESVKMTLVESIKKKCAFLENVRDNLGSDFRVLNLRAEEMGRDPLERESFDFVLSRSMTKFSPNLEFAIPLLKTGGFFLVHKTVQCLKTQDEGFASIEKAIRLLNVSIEKTTEYELPFQDKAIQYCLVVFKKNKETPSIYPRETGIPEKKPL